MNSFTARLPVNIIAVRSVKIDFDQKYYEQDDILSTFNAWNEELGMYETKTVNIEMVELYINCEILFRIGDQLYDEINEQTELPLDVEVKEEALIDA